MERNQLLRNMAPCSLLCYTCGAYKDGVMRQLSKELQHYTDGVYEFYTKHSPADTTKPLRQFKAFREELQQRSDVNCDGCRGGGHNGCSIKGCFINACVQEHNVDFCGECSEFPCDKPTGLFEDEVYLQWLNGSKQIKEIGARQYYDIKKKQSHYAAYLEE